MDGLDILLSSERFPVLSLTLVADFGIDLATKSIIAIKGFQMARVQFGAIGSRFVEVLTAGAMSGNVRRLPYRRAPKTIWPLCE